MSWRGREERSRWGEDRGRSPVWEPRRDSQDRSRGSPHRDRFRDRFDRDADRDRRERFNRDSDRPNRDFDRQNRDFDRQVRGNEVRQNRDTDRYDNRENYRNDRDFDRYDNYDSRERDRNRDRERRRSPKKNDDDSPQAPSPPKITEDVDMSIGSRSSNSNSPEPLSEHNTETNQNEKNDSGYPHATPGDWYCKCGAYNFKKRKLCYRRMCEGKKSEGVVYNGDAFIQLEGNSGITKRLLFRRLDALTTEEKILEALKERCSKSVIDSLTGITIGREPWTGASKCLAYVTFNSIADSTTAHTELCNLVPSFKVDGREVKISFYNEPPISTPKKNPSQEYSNYYAQGGFNPSQLLSETDRVNAAAAVAQSAISAAQARQMSWTPSVPAFVSGNTPSTAITNVPTGDGKTKHTAPDVRTFMYDETSGYYYDPATGLYYDGNTQYFYNNHSGQYMYWDSNTSTYITATQAHQNTNQPKLPNPPEATVENTISKEPEEKKKRDKEDKVKVAKKIAKDMERWAKALNQKKENARSNFVAEQTLDTGPSKGSADIGFSVLGAGPSLTTQINREVSPPPSTDEFLIKSLPENTASDDDEGIIDWQKLTCLLCKRKFPSTEVLLKHKNMSELHKQNLSEYNQSIDSLPQSNGYRDRAAERRMKFGEDEPIIKRRFEPRDSVSNSPAQIHPQPSVVDTIGGKMLQKMGWSQGRGLGKEEQGRIAPIEAEQRPSLAGLGQKRGIYTPTPGLTYRDTVKQLMIARYKEVVGQEESDK